MARIVPMPPASAAGLIQGTRNIMMYRQESEARAAEKQALAEYRQDMLDVQRENNRMALLGLQHKRAVDQASIGQRQQEIEIKKTDSLLQGLGLVGGKRSGSGTGSGTGSGAKVPKSDVLFDPEYKKNATENFIKPQVDNIIGATRKGVDPPGSIFGFGEKDIDPTHRLTMTSDFGKQYDEILTEHGIISEQERRHLKEWAFEYYMERFGRRWLLRDIEGDVPRIEYTNELRDAFLGKAPRAITPAATGGATAPPSNATQKMQQVDSALEERLPRGYNPEGMEVDIGPGWGANPMDFAKAMGMMFSGLAAGTRGEYVPPEGPPTSAQIEQMQKGYATPDTVNVPPVEEFLSMTPRQQFTLLSQLTDQQKQLLAFEIRAFRQANPAPAHILPEIPLQ